jgi:hypothetical protein
MTTRTPILDAVRETRISVAPKGIDLIRTGIAKAMAPNMGEAALYAAERWGEKAKATRVLKASVPGLVTSTGAGDAMSDLAQARTEFFDAVRAASIVGKLPLRRIGFRTRTLTMDEGARISWRAEGSAYINSPLKMTSSTGLERFDLGALIVVSKEVLEDESFEAELTVRNDLVKALAAAIDSAFIDPANSGSAGSKPASVTSGAGGSVSPAESLFDFGDSFQGVPNNAWIVINPWAAARLYSAARPDIGSRGGTWGGFPVITSTAMPDGFFAILDPDQIAIALGDANIRASDNALVDMVDSSSMTSGPNVAAASTVSMFQVNARAIIGSVSANWRLAKDDAVLLYDLQSFGLAGGL